MDVNLLAIKIDPGTALTTLDQATAKLRAAESQGAQTQKSLAGLSGSFKSLQSALEQENAAYTRLVASQNQQLASLNAASRANQTWQAQLLREREMLDAIHGPAQRLAQDTATLNSLMAKGSISASEYTAAIAKAHQAAGSGPASSGLGALGGLGGFGGLGVAGGAALAVKGIIDIRDAWTEAENHARKFVDTGHDIHVVMADQIELSRSLHMDLEATMGAFDDVGDAVERLNMSYSSTIELTKTLSEASTLDYKSTGQLTQELMQLSVAFETGGRVAGPLRQLFRDSPALAHLMTDNLHMTEQQIVELAAKGELSFKDVTRALAMPGPALEKLHDDFNSRSVTMRQHWHEFVQDLERPVDLKGMWEQLDPAQQAAQKIKKLADELQDGTGIWQGASTAIDKYNRSLKEAIASARTDIWSDQFKPLQMLTDGYNLLGVAVGKYVDYTLKQRQSAKAHTELTHTMTAEEQMLQRLHGAYDQAYKDLATVEVLYAKGKISLGEYNDELARNRDILGMPVPSALEPHLSSQTPDLYEQQTRQWEVAFQHRKGVIDKYARLSMENTSGPAQNLAYGGKFELPAPNVNELPPNATAAALQLASAGSESIHTLVEKSKSPWEQFVQQATDSAGQIKTALDGAFGAIEDSLVDMVTKGRLDLSSLGSALEQIAVRFAVQQATGGLLGLIGGGMTGFDYMTPGGGGRYALPGFATGGDMLVGGAGAPDSKLAMFRVSPGESIHVRTPQQREAAMAGGAGGTTIVNAFNFDQKAFRSKIMGDVMNAVRNNPAAFRALLGL